MNKYVHVLVLITYQGLLKNAILLKVIMINARAFFAKIKIILVNKKK